MDVGYVAEEGAGAIATTSNNTKMDIGDFEEEGAVATTSAEFKRYSFENLSWLTILFKLIYWFLI